MLSLLLCPSWNNRPLPLTVEKDKVIEVVADEYTVVCRLLVKAIERRD